MINRVVLVGRLTSDPTLRKTQTDISVASYTIAINRRFQQQEQTTDFINCVAWNKTADFISTYGKKGTLVGIEGRIQSRSYDDETGKRVYVTEVVCDSVQLLESKATNEARANSEQVQEEEQQAQTYNFGISSDDLPF